MSPITELGDESDLSNEDTLGTLATEESNTLSGESSGEDDVVTEEESSESEDDDASGPLNFAITAPKEVKQMIIAICRSNEFVFPTYNGKRHVHPHQLDRLLEQLRNMFWNHRRVVVEYDHATFVTERPPLGSMFEPDGYYTPNGVFVPKEAREGVQRLKMRYREIQHAQERASDAKRREETSLSGKGHAPR